MILKENTGYVIARERKIIYNLFIINAPGLKGVYMIKILSKLKRINDPTKEDVCDEMKKLYEESIKSQSEMTVSDVREQYIKSNTKSGDCGNLLRLIMLVLPFVYSESNGTSSKIVFIIMYSFIEIVIHIIESRYNAKNNLSHFVPDDDIKGL